MPGSFFDSSAVAKLYHRELGTEQVQGRFTVGRVTGIGNYISRLAVIEVQSVFMKKLRTGLVTKAAVQLLRDRFLGDIRRRWFQVVALRTGHYEAAEHLLQTYGEQHALRTLDALQIAVALDLRGRGLADTFFSADRALCKVATAAGLGAFNPEDA